MWTRQKQARHQKIYQQNLRKAVVVLLGGRCLWCGFSDVRALQIDHINGGGNKESKKLRSAGIYRKIIQGAKGYQLLCANCNWIKRVQNKEVGDYLQ